MSDINTGGPAFSQCVYNMKGGYDITGGMTLRDYFAAKAMQAHIVSSMGNLLKAYADDPDAINPIIARASCEMADAMLKAREA